AKTVLMTSNISMGYGLHLLQLIKEDPINSGKLSPNAYAITAISLWTFVLPKFPVVALLVRLFSINSRHLGKILYSMVGILAVWNLMMTIVTYVKCNPAKKNWAPATPGTCWDPAIYLNLGYFSGGIVACSALLDFIFALYPILQVSKLQMERSRKVLIACSFSLGILAGVVSLYKLTTIKRLVNAQDPTFATVPVDVWNCAEYTSLILAASVPMTRPIVILFAKKAKELASQLTSRFSGSGSRGTVKYISDNGTTDGTGSRYGRFSSRNGYKQQKSGDEILLQETHRGVSPVSGSVV
ncbi:hypothetical protein K504DRAFT_380677, partial [Pleomassaria siparia CBS 279.74]